MSHNNKYYNKNTILLLLWYKLLYLKERINLEQARITYIFVLVKIILNYIRTEKIKQSKIYIKLEVLK